MDIFCLKKGELLPILFFLASFHQTAITSCKKPPFNSLPFKAMASSSSKNSQKSPSDQIKTLLETYASSYSSSAFIALLATEVTPISIGLLPFWVQHPKISLYSFLQSRTTSFLTWRIGKGIINRSFQ